MATARGEDVAWPVCAPLSRRVHGRCVRRLADTPVSGQEMLIHLRVRRFFCDVPGYSRPLFAEQAPGLTMPHTRHSRVLTGMLVGRWTGGSANSTPSSAAWAVTGVPS
ncbi:transposase family protein [Halostreptopolyspora alba]|uniref:transposase family protein n=1 Tax=Halostreptopolyspora alba TaxID=2487137 RepID=UPI00371F9617